jgi:integrase
MPKKRAEPYLFERGNVYHAIMEIPKTLRPKFAGKPRFAVSLDTDSLAVARRRRDRHVLDWKDQLARAKGERGDTEYWRQQAEILSDGEGQPTPLYWRRRLRGAKDEDERRRILEQIDAAAIELGVETVDNPGDDPTGSPDARRFYAEAVGAMVPFAEYLDEWLRASRATDKTKDMQRADVERFTAKFPMVSDVTRPEVRRWITGLMNEVVSRDTKALTPKTVQRILSALRGYWRYLQTIKVAAEDDEPFSKLDVARQAKRTEPRSSWRPFKPKEVVTLLNAAVKSGDDELADLIRLGMWTGCRIEELCALKIEQVRRDHFAVEDAKTAAGWREVPIHAKVAPVFKRLIGKRKTGYVLEGLTANKYDDRSNAIGKRFGRLKSSKGLGSQYVYHSIRKTVVTILENAGVPENVVASIIGHDVPTLTFGLYSGGVSLAVKREALTKLAYHIRT